MTEITKEQAWGDGGFIAVSAVRYALGRMTYVVEETADWVIANWDMLPLDSKNIIRRDIEKAFEKDELARVNFLNLKPLGADCDRKQWERVRVLWKKQEK